MCQLGQCGTTSCSIFYFLIFSRTCSAAPLLLPCFKTRTVTRYHCVRVALQGDTMFVANVGDSRAIVCTQQPGTGSTVRPLSVDQTPFRRDERERIKKAGGHVLTIDQIEGLEVRAWRIPAHTGTVMFCSWQSRSLASLFSVSHRVRIRHIYLLVVPLQNVVKRTES